MDWLTFLATVIGHLAWPSVAGLLLILLRPQIGGLAERIEEVAFPGGASAKFGKAVAAGREKLEQVTEPAPQAAEHLSLRDNQLLELANSYPEAAVLEAYRSLESILIEIRSRLSLNVRTNLRGVISRLYALGLVDDRVAGLFDSVRVARNAAAHSTGSSRIGPGEAAEFIQQVSYLQAHFKSVLMQLPASPAGT